MSYPFTAPSVSPEMNWRCSSRKTRIAGTAAVSALAMISPQPMPGLIRSEQREPDRHGADRLAVRHHERDEELLPALDEAVDAHGRERRARHRQAMRHQMPNQLAPVNARALLHLARQVPHEAARA